MHLKFYAKARILKTKLSKKLAVLALLGFLAAGNVNAQAGNALSFGGTDDLVEVPNHPAINISSAITIEAWINHSKNTGVQNVVCKSSASVNNSYSFPRTEDGWANIQFWLDINGVGPVVLSVPYGRTTFRNQWHHVAATFDGVYMRIYIDGVLKGSLQTPGGDITVNNNPLAIGGHTGLEEYFGGKVDDIRIWNRALTQCEIAANRSCHLTGSENGLAAYYKLDQGIANLPNLGLTTVDDGTSNDNDGTFVAGNILDALLSINWVTGIVSSTVTCTPFTPIVPVAGAAETVIPVGGTISLTASGGDTYAWTGPNGFSSTQQNPVINGAGISASGTYTVVISRGGCSASASVIVTVANRAKALMFDGSDDLIRIPNSASFNATTELTIEGWVYPTRNTPLVQNIVSKSNWSQNNGYIFPRTDDGWQNFSFWLAINGQWKVVSAPYPGLNQWTHVAATYDGVYMKIYINGTLVGTLSAPGTITENTNATTIGQQDGYTEYFKGGVDELRLWNRALPQCEIQNNQNCELNGANNGLASLQGLAAYYRFNQGLVNVDNAQHTSLVDSSGNNNHGSLIGFNLSGTNSNWSTGGTVNNSTCSPYVPVNVVASNNGPVLEVGSTIQLSVSSGTAWSWTGPLGFTSTLQNPTIPNSTINRSGIYSVTVTGNGCTSVANTSLQVAYKAGTLHFDGVDDQVTVPNSPSLNIRKEITLEGWIKPTNNTKLVQSVMGKSSNDVNTGYIFPRTDDAWTSYIFYLHINGEWQKLSAPYPAINQWHHVAATYDGFWMRIYLDGVLSASKLLPDGGDISLNANDLVIGQQPGFTENFEGNLEEARVWNRALSQCEIINNMECEVAQMQNNGLVAYYKFNQGFIDADNRNITTLTDATSNANNGLLQNFSLQGIPSNWSEFKISGTCSTYAQPPVAVSSNGSIFGIGSTIRLFATGGFTYEWEGPNNFSSVIANPTINNAQTNATGVYTVTAPFVRCVITASKRITVSVLQPIQASGPTTFCPSQSVTLSINQSGATAYQWFRNGVEIQGANSSSYVATTSGDYAVTVTTATDVLVSVPVTVTVEDNLAPQPTVANLPVLNLQTPAVVPAPTAIDNCAGTLTATTQDPVSFDEAGTYQIIWTYNDGNNNTISQTQTVVVTWGHESVPPVLTVPADITLNANTTVCGAVASFTATATDNRPDPVAISYSHNSGSVFPVGTTIVIVTATDASGNTTTGSFNVTVNPTVVAPITGNTTICAGSATTLSSATAGATWSSGNTNIATVDQYGVVTAVSAGTVQISYTDACGVSAIATVTVNAVPSTPVVSVVDNCGSSTLSTSASGSLLWSNGATTSSITVSDAGTYTVKQTVNGCESATGSATAAPKAIPSTPVVTVIDNCGSSTLSTNAAGSLLWSNGATTSSITVSAAGTYSVKQTVAGCESAAGSATAAPKLIPSAPVVTVVNNCGSSTLSTNATGSLLWSNGATTPSITVSDNNTYTVTQTIDGCESAAGSGTAAPKATPSTPVVTVVNNCGSSTLSTNAAGSLLWSNGATTASITVSDAGTYTVKQTVDGCESASGAGVAAPLAVPSTPVVTVENNCGSSTLSTNAAGVLLWSNGATTSSITVSAAGTYSVKQTVAGCESAAGSATAAPNAIPSAPVVTVANNCGSSTLSTNAAGSLLWSNGATTSSITVYEPGVYTVKQTVGGCESAAGSATAAPNAIPSAPVVTVVNNCGSSTLSTNATGALLWSNGATTSSITVSAAGTYSVKQTVAGCESAAGSATAAPNAIPSAPVVTVVNNCGSSTLSTNATGALLWSNGATTSSITVSAAGTYSVKQTVAGCESAAGSATAAPKAIPSAPVVTVVNNCGSSTLSTNAAGSLLWSNGATGSYIVVTTSGSYSVTASVNGCTSAAGSASVVVTTVPVVGAIAGTTTVTAGSTTQLSNGTTGGVWTSNNTNIATVSANGLVSGVSAGTAVISYTVSSAPGCSTVVTATVTVNPNCVAPVISVSNVEEGTPPTSTSCNAAVTYAVNIASTPTATVTYTFSGATTGSGSGTGSGAVFNVGVTTVEVKAVNGCGTATKTFTVTLKDRTAPVPNVAALPTVTGTCSVSLVASSSNNNNDNDCDYSFRSIIAWLYYLLGNYWDCDNNNHNHNNNNSNNNSGNSQNNSNAPKATDNCKGTITGTTTDPLTYTTQGTYTINWKFDDGNGNISYQQQTVVVKDEVKPVINCPGNITISCGSNTTPSGCNSTATATDNCGTPVVTYTDVVDGNVIFRTWKATDAAQNSSTCVQRITLVDNSRPTISDVSDRTVSCNGSTDPSATGTPTAYDNCGTPAVTYSDATNGNVITRTWKATDAAGNYSTSTQRITVGNSFTVSVASKPTSNTYTGGISTNLYLGYGAQSTKLEVCNLPSSGAPYSYSWSGSATNRLNTTSSSAPTFTPTTNGTFTFLVTVTNKYGCTSTDYITICVTDIRVPGSNGKKVYICHKNKSRWGNSYQTLEVSTNAVAGHFDEDRCGNNDHDDRLGSCDQTPCNTSTSVNSVVSSNKQGVTSEGGVVATTATNNTSAITTEEELKVTVLPNPSTTYFTLKFASRYETPLDIRVMDGNGRVVDARSKIGANSTIQIGHNYSSGMYYAEISQNGKRKVIQLIKARG